MATKTFDELKQLAIQIRDEKTNKQNTATRVGTEMLEHLNKLEQDYYDKTTINNRTSEYNVSLNHPTSGLSGSNKYDLSSAIAQVPAELRTAGLTISFLNSAGDTEKWEFGGGSWATNSFSQVGVGKFNMLKDEVDKSFGKKLNASNDSESRIKDLSDGFFFCDKSGNIIAIIKSDGVHSINFYDKEGNIISAIDLADKGLHVDKYEEGFYFTDLKGNIIAKIDSNGLQAIKFIDKDGNEIGGVYGENGTSLTLDENKVKPTSIPVHKLYNKLVVSLGDSHRTAAWYDKFCELTGSNRNSEIDNYIGNHQYDYDVCGLMMGQAMALKQYCKDNELSPALILIENCHFGAITEDISYYAPLREDNVIVKQYASSQNWKENFSTDLPDILASNTPKLRSVIKATFNTKKLTLPFSATTVNAGTIILTINSQEFNITIEEGETLSDAITKLNDWAFDDYTDWSNADTKGQIRTDSIELKYIGDNIDSPHKIIFDGGTTGISIGEISETTTSGSQRYQFNSFKLSDWSNSSKWLATNGTTCYPAMKGLLEYLKENFPSTEIVVWAVQWLSCYKPATNKEPTFAHETFVGSGIYTLNIDDYYANASAAKYLSSKEVMKKAAEYYNCRFLDVDKCCGINIFNMFNGYYNENDLHPRRLGYEEWGVTLATLY